MSNLQGSRGGGAKDQQSGGLRYPTNGKTIYHRPLNRAKAAELSGASFAYLFSEMVSYASKKIESIQDLEKRCVVSVALFFCSLPPSPSLPPHPANPDHVGGLSLPTHAKV